MDLEDGFYWNQSVLILFTNLEKYSSKNFTLQGLKRIKKRTLKSVTSLCLKTQNWTFQNNFTNRVYFTGVKYLQNKIHVKIIYFAAVTNTDMLNPVSLKDGMTTFLGKISQ